MFKRKKGQSKTILVVLAFVFAIGLILGTLAFHYVPDETLEDATQALELSRNESFLILFKENFCFEILWVAALWLSGSNSFSAPFAGAIVAMRGFVLGFTRAFVLTGNHNEKLLYTHVLPQCVTALPSMSLVALVCILRVREKTHHDRYGRANYLLYLIAFLCLTLLVAAFESGFMLILRKCF